MTYWLRTGFTNGNISLVDGPYMSELGAFERALAELREGEKRVEIITKTHPVFRIHATGEYEVLDPKFHRELGRPYSWSTKGWRAHVSEVSGIPTERIVELKQKEEEEKCETTDKQ